MRLELPKSPRLTATEAESLLLKNGFSLLRTKGSHRIYIRDGVKEMLNFQNVHGKAKPYQVRQLIKVIEKYNLLEENDTDV